MKVIKLLQQEEVELIKLGYSPFGKPRMVVYCFYLDGLLIDTGQPNMRRPIIDLFKNKPIQTCIITHHHEDHCGNLPYLQHQYNFETFAHPLCCELLPNPRRISFAERLIWGQHQPCTAKPIDDFLKYKNYNFEIIHTPGHAEDMISLYEKNKGWLFSADNYVHDYIKFFGFYESMWGQIQSLKKLLTYDFDLMFCSHNPIFKQPKQRLANKLQFFEDFFGKVKASYEQGYSPKGIMKELNLKENLVSKWMAQGQLSTEWMVKSVIRDIKAKQL